jgi:hypothetical protein
MQRDFRGDIEGLRAFAVLPVVLFHLDPAWCPGGFAGVDIFFVISGYLITRMILAEGAAFDVESHRNAPAGLRLWCGCTVETADVQALTLWLDWAFETAVAE